MTIHIPWTADELDGKINKLANEIAKLRRFKRLLWERDHYREVRSKDPEFVAKQRVRVKGQAPRDRSEYMREYHARPEVKARKNAHRGTPETREKRRAYMAEYRSTPEFKQKRKLRDAGITDAAVIAAEVARLADMRGQAAQ